MVIILSIFSKFSGRGLNKRREAHCDEARIFIQVHFIRERGSDKYAFNALSLKSDSERDECNEWYAAHGNLDNFQDIVNIYLDENKLKSPTICSEYGLEARIFSKVSDLACPVEKWEAIAICFGLDLNISEARALLKTVGYSLINSSETDLVIRYCFENDIYRIEDINYILEKLCKRKLNQII